MHRKQLKSTHWVHRKQLKSTHWVHRKKVGIYPLSAQKKSWNLPIECTERSWIYPLSALKGVESTHLVHRKELHLPIECTERSWIYPLSAQKGVASTHWIHRKKLNLPMVCAEKSWNLHMVCAEKSLIYPVSAQKEVESIYWVHRKQLNLYNENTASSWIYPLSAQKRVESTHGMQWVVKMFIQYLFVNQDSYEWSRASLTGPRSTVGNVSDNRCESDCRFSGREFHLGPVPYFCGDRLWNNFYRHSPPFCWIIQEGLLSVTSKSMCTKNWLTACSSLPRKKVWLGEQTVPPCP